MTTNNFSQLPAQFRAKAKEVQTLISERMPKSVGAMLVDGFRESFDLQKFNDEGEAPWQEVKRRTPGSPWYGFQYKEERRTSVAFTRDRATGRTMRAKRQKRLNFSSRAATRAILFGSGSSNMQGSIYLHTATRGRVIVATDQEHAQVHNEGLKAKVFNRHTFTMPKRQFMGTSSRLNQRARQIIDKSLRQIMT